jgi:hypothetical protein
MSTSDDHVRVGRVEIPLTTARTWVTEYTNAAANQVSEAPYAFPAYDAYSGGTMDPRILTDGDLLAPVLLNVQVKIRTFYGLQRIREQLQEALGASVLDKPLAKGDPREVAAAVRALYGVLDAEDAPWGVGGTTLSKVLHRKRPRSLVLHDKWVRICYVGDEGRVPTARTRSWADYMVLVTEAVRNDITTQREAFDELRHAASAAEGRTHVSDVRLLDILAWKSQGNSPTDEPGAPDDETTPTTDAPDLGK